MMKKTTSVLKPSLDLRSVIQSTPGNFPWDQWERWAIARGLAEDLAYDGRALIREAFQHGWDPWLQRFCGWADDGKALLADALRSPKATRLKWEVLMRTDGFRGDHLPNSGQWVLDYLRTDAQQLLASMTPGPRVSSQFGFGR